MKYRYIILKNTSYCFILKLQIKYIKTILYIIYYIFEMNHIIFTMLQIQQLFLMNNFDVFFAL